MLIFFPVKSFRYSRSDDLVCFSLKVRQYIFRSYPCLFLLLLCFVTLYYELIYTNHFTPIISYIIMFVNIFCKRLQEITLKINILLQTLFIIMDWKTASGRKSKIYVFPVEDITWFSDKKCMFSCCNISHTITEQNKTRSKTPQQNINAAGYRIDAAFVQTWYKW